jgi:hypothetical protein
LGRPAYLEETCPAWRKPAYLEKTLFAYLEETCLPGGDPACLVETACIEDNSTVAHDLSASGPLIGVVVAELCSMETLLTLIIYFYTKNSSE